MKYFVGAPNEPPSSRCESVFNLFFCSVVNWKLFLFELCEKNQCFLSRFCAFSNCDLRTNLIDGFLQTSSPFVKKTCIKLPKGNLFCPNNAPETYIYIS